MITLTVTVSGGRPPVNIQVYIDNLNNTHDIGYTRSRSFSEPHNLPSGEYVLVVGGQNPSGGSTQIRLEGDFASGPMPSSPATRSSKIYSAAFYFTI